MPQMNIGRVADARRGRQSIAAVRKSRSADRRRLLPSPVVENRARPRRFRGCADWPRHRRRTPGRRRRRSRAPCRARSRGSPCPRPSRRAAQAPRFNLADQRIVGSGDLLHVRVAGEARRWNPGSSVRIRSQMRERLVPLPEIRLEVGEIEERRDIARIERERGVELRFRRVVPAQAVRVDDAAIEMDFLRPRNAAVERLLVRGERGVEAAARCAAKRRGCTSYPADRASGRASARTRPPPPAGGRRAGAASPRAAARGSPRSLSRQSFPQDGLPGCRCAEMIARAAGRRGDRLACGARDGRPASRPTTGDAGSTAATGACWT